MIGAHENVNFSTWNSSISAKMVAKNSTSFTDLFLDNEIIYWTESRPNEKGRTVIVSYQKNGLFLDETTPEYSVGTSVHGYGGGAFCVKNNHLYFSDSKSGFVFHKNLSTNLIEPIVQTLEARYADFCVDPKHDFLYCIRKVNNTKNQFPITELVRISIKNKEVEVLLSGYDFYSNPIVSPDGKKIAWLQWNHPNMPWDSTELWIADILPNSSIKNILKLSNDLSESFYQPTWSEDNFLYVCSDRSNFWNIYKFVDGVFENIFEKKADFGRPMWITGTRCFDFLNRNEIISSYCEKGVWKTGVLCLISRSFKEIENSLTCIYNIVAKNNKVAYFGGNSTLPLAVLSSEKKDINSIKILKTSIENVIDEKYVSIPELISFSTRDNDISYGFYYAPKNPDYILETGKLPPLIVKVHGGPTACADLMFNSKIQYYTSRGFAFVEINYRGSTGYGRQYREQLKGMWGVRDVEDCIDGALYLCNQKKVDRNKLIISGTSSGGFTVLNSLVLHDIYKCGSCTYGISDLISMSEHIHKFEAYYDQGLLGGTLQNSRKIYVERSPINNVKKIKAPIIFFHGDKDVVVNFEQTLKMSLELNQNKIYNEMYIISDEGHGFKKMENILFLMEKELSFYEKYGC